MPWLASFSWQFLVNSIARIKWLHASSLHYYDQNQCETFIGQWLLYFRLYHISHCQHYLPSQNIYIRLHLFLTHSSWWWELLVTLKWSENFNAQHPLKPQNWKYTNSGMLQIYTVVSQEVTVCIFVNYKLWISWTEYSWLLNSGMLQIYTVVSQEVTVCIFVNDKLWISWTEYSWLLFIRVFNITI